jgi:hypothetical protein
VLEVIRLILGGSDRLIRHPCALGNEGTDVVRPSQISSTARMARLLFHSGGQRKPLAMITAYIDESGTHQGSKLLVLAAFVGEQSEWDSIEARFRKANKLAGRTFHAVDCAQGGKEFRGMHKDKRYRIHKKMVRVVNDHEICGLGYGVYLEDYAEVYPRNGEKWEKWLRGAYRLMFAHLVVRIASHTLERYPGERVSLIVEDSPHWYSVASHQFLTMKRDKKWSKGAVLETIAPYSTEDAPQLHAPDLLAYEAYLLKVRQRYPTKHPVREHMARLAKNELLGHMWGKDNLEKWKKRQEERAVARLALEQRSDS